MEKVFERVGQRHTSCVCGAPAGNHSYRSRGSAGAFFQQASLYRFFDRARRCLEQRQSDWAT